MKSRLSLTVDPQVTYWAKRVARARNQSLSSMVEDLLRQASESEAVGVTDPFSERWAGKLVLKPKDESRFKHLASKYDL